MKNNKSPGVDEIVIEQIKYSPSIIHEQIAEMYNEMASSGDHPTEIIQGVLCPIQKSGKTIGPPNNLRPIILLSVLRKILAVLPHGKKSENVLTTKYHQPKRHIEKVVALESMFLVRNWLLKELSHLGMKPFT